MLEVEVVHVPATVGGGVVHVEQGVLGLVLADESLDRPVVEHLHSLHAVAGDETVLHDHHRQQETLGDAHRLDDVVVDLLGVLGVELNPARVTGPHGVGVVAVDVEGGREGPVDHGHDDGQMQRGGDVDHLPHEGQPRRGGGGHHPAPGGRGADAGAHGRVLALHGDELGVHQPVGHEVGEGLHDGRLGGDGVGSQHIRIYLAHGLSYRVGSVQSPYL